MFEGLLNPTHLIFLLVIALLIFGPRKLPDLGRGLGEGIRGFQKAVRGIGEEGGSSDDKSKAEQVHSSQR